MNDPNLEAAFEGAARAQSPGRSYTPKLPIGAHTVIIKQFNKKNTRSKGVMFNAEVHVLDSDKEEVKDQARSWPWFTGADANGIQDRYLRGFIEAVARSINDTKSTIPQLGALLAGAQQTGRGMMLKVVVTEQYDKKGNVKKDPETGEAYTEALWYPIAQTPEEVVAGRSALDADPRHAIREAQQEQGQSAAVARPAVTQPAQQTTQPASTGGSATSLLAQLGKKA